MKESRIAGGRIGIYCPDHPKANSRGYILRSRYIIESILGRYLGRFEIVHHIDGNQLNDSLDNLHLMSLSLHTSLHHKINSSENKPGTKRILDYNKIHSLMKTGLGYRRIAKITGYKVKSVKYACKIIKTKGPN